MALYVSFSFQTSTSPIRIGLPILSFTLIGSISRLRARKESFFLFIKGFTQKKPVSVKVPLYLPKNTIARASFGSWEKYPGIIRIAAARKRISSRNKTILPLKRIKLITIRRGSIAKLTNKATNPLITTSLYWNSFAFIGLNFDIILISQIYHFPFW